MCLEAPLEEAALQVPDHDPSVAAAGDGLSSAYLP